MNFDMSISTPTVISAANRPLPARGPAMQENSRHANNRHSACAMESAEMENWIQSRLTHPPTLPLPECRMLVESTGRASTSPLTMPSMRYVCAHASGICPAVVTAISTKPIAKITAAAKAGIRRFSRFHAALAATRENTVKGVETASEASEASDICPAIYEVLVVIERYLKAVLEGS